MLSDSSRGLVGASGAALLCALLANGVPYASAADPPGDVAQGKVLYERYCVSCHGEHGDGDGEAASSMAPKPRDYRPGIFKSRSTPSGSLPLTSDLERTLENGLYGTRMPSWYAIGHRARRNVIAYIQTFSARWQTEEPKPPIAIPAEPASSPQSVARGNEVYQQNGCAECHGDRGLGDGPSAKSGMQDAWGNPTSPANLTAHGKYGDTGTDRYRVLMTGLDGTPMASFAEALTPDQAWDLVHYLQSLRAEGSPRDHRLEAAAELSESVPAVLGFLFGE